MDVSGSSCKQSGYSASRQRRARSRTVSGSAPQTPPRSNTQEMSSCRSCCSTAVCDPPHPPSGTPTRREDSTGGPSRHSADSFSGKSSSSSRSRNYSSSSESVFSTVSSVSFSPSPSRRQSDRAPCDIVLNGRADRRRKPSRSALSSTGSSRTSSSVSTKDSRIHRHHTTASQPDPSHHQDFTKFSPLVPSRNGRSSKRSRRKNRKRSRKRSSSSSSAEPRKKKRRKKSRSKPEGSRNKSSSHKSCDKNNCTRHSRGNFSCLYDSSDASSRDYVCLDKDGQDLVYDREQRKRKRRRRRRSLCKRRSVALDGLNKRCVENDTPKRNRDSNDDIDFLKDRPWLKSAEIHNSPNVSEAQHNSLKVKLLPSMSRLGSNTPYSSEPGNKEICCSTPKSCRVKPSNELKSGDFGRTRVSNVQESHAFSFCNYESPKRSPCVSLNIPKRNDSETDRSPTAYRLTSTPSSSTAAKETWASEFAARGRSYRYTFIDSHCHLDFLYTRMGVASTTKFSQFMSDHAHCYPANYEGCVAVFCNPRTFDFQAPDDRVLATVAEESSVWLAVGCHPKSATDFTSSHERGLRKMLTHPKVVALGEIGLDYSGKFSIHADVQKKVLVTQLRLAIELDHPLVIHCRDADDDCLEIMLKHVPRQYKIHLHCFTRDSEVAERWLEAFPNLLLGLTPVVTYRSAWEPAQVARAIPLDRLLLETDAPYFLPGPVRSSTEQFSHPGFALFTAEKVAELRGISVDVVLKACRENTRRMFGI